MPNENPFTINDLLVQVNAAHDVYTNTTKPKAKEKKPKNTKFEFPKVEYDIEASEVYVKVPWEHLYSNKLSTAFVKAYIALLDEAGNTVRLASHASYTFRSVASLAEIGSAYYDIVSGAQKNLSSECPGYRICWVVMYSNGDTETVYKKSFMGKTVPIDVINPHPYKKPTKTAMPSAKLVELLDNA